MRGLFSCAARPALQPAEQSCERCVARITRTTLLRCMGADGGSRMLKQNDDASDTGERPEIRVLLERVLREGRAWAEAEAELTRLELGDLKRQALRATMLMAVGAAALLCMLLAFTQAAVALLALYMPVPAAAAIVGAVLAIVAGCCWILARRGAPYPRDSMLLRWLFHGGGDR